MDSTLHKNSLSNAEIESIRTICVLGWGLLGDVLIRVPVIEALKKRLPHARITVVVDPYSMAALENHPDCDELFIYTREKKPLWKYICGTIKNLLILRRRKFDLSINLYSGGASPQVARIINARIRVGFDHTARLRWSNTVSVPKPSFCQNWTRAFGLILQPLGINQEQVRMGTSYFCTDESRKIADALLSAKDIRYLAINLGAGDPAKAWQVERYVALLSRICGEFECIPVIISNPGQEHLSEMFAMQYPTPNFIKLNSLPLEHVAAVVEKCDLIITGDTGLMHLASGVKTPIFALFLATHPNMVIPEDVPFGACMQSVAGAKDKCGWPLVSKELPVDIVYPQFRKFLKDTIGW